MIAVNESFLLFDDENQDTAARATMFIPPPPGPRLRTISLLSPGTIVSTPQDLAGLLETVNFACEEIPECLWSSISAHYKQVKKLLPSASWVKGALDHLVFTRADLQEGFEYYLRANKRRWPFGGAMAKASKAVLEEGLRRIPDAEAYVIRAKKERLTNREDCRYQAIEKYRGWNVGDEFLVSTNYGRWGPDPKEHFRIIDVLVDGYRCHQIIDGNVNRYVRNMKFHTMMNRGAEKV